MATRLDDLVAAVKATLNDATVEHYVGRKHLAHHAPGRRVIWARNPSSIETPRRTGGTQVGTDRVTDCALRVENVSAYVAAITDRTVTSEEATEELFELLIAAIALTCGPSAVCRRYEWISEGAKVAGETLRVAVIELQLELRLPVLEEIKPLVAVIGSLTSATLNDEDDNAEVQVEPPNFLVYNGTPLIYTP